MNFFLKVCAQKCFLGFNIYIVPLAVYVHSSGGNYFLILIIQAVPFYQRMGFVLSNTKPLENPCIGQVSKLRPRQQYPKKYETFYRMHKCLPAPGDMAHTAYTMRGITCGTCGNVNGENFQFCTECGAPLTKHA